MRICLCNGLLRPFATPVAIYSKPYLKKIFLTFDFDIFLIAKSPILNTTYFNINVFLQTCLYSLLFNPVSMAYLSQTPNLNFVYVGSFMLYGNG